jgi:hypothetical protein
MTDLAAMPADESEALLVLARGIEAANDTLQRFKHMGRKFCEEIARVRAARTILAAAEWRDRFARDIGWRKMRFSAQRKTALQKIIAETERRAHRLRCGVLNSEGRRATHIPAQSSDRKWKCRYARRWARRNSRRCCPSPSHSRGCSIGVRDHDGHGDCLPLLTR